MSRPTSSTVCWRLPVSGLAPSSRPLSWAIDRRFPDADSPPLHWVLLHLTQEYARHTGHLDLAREMIEGETGEAWPRSGAIRR